jgi:subtilisin family serine protease
MNRFLTLSKRGVLSRAGSLPRFKGSFARPMLGMAAMALLSNPVFPQGVMGRHDPQREHRPAYRLQGTSLATLRSTQLPVPTGDRTTYGSAASGQSYTQSNARTEFVKDRILVAFRDGTTPEEKREILSQAPGQLQRSPESVNPHFDIVQIAAGDITAEEAIARLRSDPRVRVAEPDYIVHTQDSVPNDPYFGYQWALQNLGQGYYPSTCRTCSKPGADISATKAWELTAGSSQVVVAVIDTGVDYNHPDLAANILRDNSGKVVGYDYVNMDDDPMDDFGHGTHCAGTIGAVGNNGIGVAGVCWNVKIMPLKFLGASGSGNTSDAVSCIDFAISHGAHILSNSWGGGGFSQLLLDAIRRAEKAGILFVAAAGNGAMDIDQGGFYPAGYARDASNVISVAATDAYDVLASFSNYGPRTCDVAAPGVSIYSTVPSGSCPLCSSSGYAYMSGTSMATPHVAGAAALIMARYPTASVRELRARLLYSADHPVEMEGYTRKGRLNVFNAMQTDALPPGPPSDFSITQASGTGLRLRWTASGDDGLKGTVSAYQIFYNTISDVATARMIEPKMTPGPPGTLETTDLAGLVPNTVYYVSIRAVDKVGNTSSLISAGAVLTGVTGYYDGAEETPSFETSYGPPWTVTADDAHTGGHSYASPAALSKYQYSTLLMDRPYTVKGPAYLTLWVKTDLYYADDYLSMYIQDNDSTKQEYHYLGTGTSDWASYRFFLGGFAGHSIKVAFLISKGSNEATPPSHRAWIDDVAIVPLTEGWTDDVEEEAQFTGFPPWSITVESSSSPSHAWSDSPNSSYANNVRLPLMQNSSVTPPDNLGSLSLVFKAKIDLEADRDYLEVFATPDDGTHWEYLGTLTGTSDWTTYAYELPGWKKVRTLFHLVTNEVIARDGVYLDDIGVWGESFDTARAAPSYPEGTTVAMSITPGGAGSFATIGSAGATRSGYATVDISSGGTPYGTAVVSLAQGNMVVSEAAVSATPPTTAARIYIDYHSEPITVYTGLALANRGSAAANIKYILRDPAGMQLASGHGTLASGAHVARFVHQLGEIAPDFNLPADFAASIRFGSLEIGSDQPLCITALRLTVNQRGEPLLTSTPVADLLKSAGNYPIYFPQFADGGGYGTTLVLLNTSNTLETGTISFFGDDGRVLTVGTDNGNRDSQFQYSIQAGGVYVLHTSGSTADVQAGWVQVWPSMSTPSPVGAGVLGYSVGGIRVTESGIPAAIPTTHAHIYVDQSGGYDTGLALANPVSSEIEVSVRACRTDGSPAADTAPAPLNLTGNGHLARYVGQLVSGLPAGFTGVLDIYAPSPFVALTLRSLRNARGEALLTTFPIADLLQSAPEPIVFPHIADGGGYTTQFILLSAGTASGATIHFYDEGGVPLPIGK